MSKSIAITQGRRAANVNANVATVQLFPDFYNPTLPAICIAPASSVIDGKKFTICASGECTTSGAFNVTVGLYGRVAVPANPLLPGSWTNIALSTARAVGTTSAPWWMEAELVMGQVSAKLQGAFNTLINSLYDAPATLTNAIAAGVLPGGSVEPCLNFCVGIGFSTGAITNIGILKYFALEC